MAVNTKIQFRRGYSTGYTGDPIVNPGLPVDQNDPNYTRPLILFKWTDEIVLAEGEIGYEIDTGKFKIGKVSDGQLLTWVNLPYAGGSAISAQSGIGLVFDESQNAYTLYSYITGSDPNNSGISFSTLPFSQILGDENADGTAYVISLSDKLETFNSSNIDINTNTISSDSSVDGTGIIVSGYSSSEIALNPFGGIVTVSGIDIHNVFIENSDSITVTEAIGGLPKGTTLTNSSGITQVLRQILEKVFEPTVGNAGSLTISSTPTNNTNVEAGYTTNWVINSTFNRGTILGTGEGANWNSSAVQNPRLGEATGYTINGNSDADGDITYTSQQFVDGDNTIPIVVTYGTGPQPINSVGANSTTLSPAPGSTLSANAIIYGRRKLFYGVSSSVLEPPAAGDIRNLGNSILHPTTSTSFSLTAPIGTRSIVIAVPSGSNYSSVANGNFSVLDTNTNLTVTSSFDITSLNVDGDNSYTPIAYKVYYYVNAAPTTVASTYFIDLN